MTLFVEPIYYDFFTRSLVPRQHYWPISSNNQSMCNDIKYVVEWGNANPDKVNIWTKFRYNFLNIFWYCYPIRIRMFLHNNKG